MMEKKSAWEQGLDEFWDVMNSEEEVEFAPADIVDWAQENYYISDAYIDGHWTKWKKPIILEPHQKKLLRFIMKLILNHTVTTIIWSEVKKSGKTAIAGLVGQYWAEEMEPYNEIYCLANDRDQAESRVWARISKSIELRQETEPTQAFRYFNPNQYQESYDITPRYSKLIHLGRKTLVKALPHNFKGEAGANPGLSTWDELWAYEKRGEKLWDEFTPVPTREYSVRFVVTYAGFHGESTLLWGIYDDVVRPENRLPDWDLPVYLKGSTLIYWNHDPMMPWQTPAYYGHQKTEFANRPLAYRRLHKNEWIQRESALVPIHFWNDCENPDLERWHPGDKSPLYIALDASRSRDCTTMISTTFDHDKGKVVLKDHRIWQPKAEEILGGSKIVDFEETILPQLIWMRDQGANIVVVAYDPNEMGTLPLHIAREGFDVYEFSQMNMRVEADMGLVDRIMGGKFEYYPGCGELTEHIKNAVKVESSRGFRIKKKSRRKPIDAAVALSMSAHLAGSEEEGEEQVVEAAVF